MTIKEKEREIKRKIKAIDRLSGMFKVNGANRKITVNGYTFVLKST